jgi:hypothetical protein
MSSGQSSLTVFTLCDAANDLKLVDRGAGKVGQ